jgi:hypothetical protein
MYNKGLPVGEEKDFSFPQSTEKGSVAHPASHSIGTMSYFSGHSFQSTVQTTHLLLIQSLRMRELYLYYPQNSFIEYMGETLPPF